MDMAEYLVSGEFETKGGNWQSKAVQTLETNMYVQPVTYQ